jgi:acetyl esterase/lipase
MRIEDYPPQEPLSEFARRYHDEAIARAAEGGSEHAYGDDPYQRLIVFAAGGAATGDVLLFLHGGGWTNGYKEWMSFMAPALTKAGVTFVTAGYRLAPAHVFPAGYHDVQAALAWVRGHIAAHGGDAGRIFVGGHSAGGHYATLLAVDRDVAAGTLRGALPISGTYYFTEGSGLSMRPRFLGAPGAGAEEAASPMARIRGDAAPLLIAHGTEDFPHLMRQAAEFEAAMAAAGADIERILLPGRNHASASFAAGEPDGPWVRPAVAWMRRH